jgi:thiamine pyrophosphate-dependent acetolactate synthase large subunit-like protein
MKWFRVQHEEVAAFAAATEAHLTDHLYVSADAAG